MIGKVAVRGTNAGGLLRYLFGPGRANEHTDPHVVAGFDEPSALEPGFRPTHPGRDVRALAELLDQPLALTEHPPGKPVYHLVLRNAPGDRRLFDAEWQRVCADAMHETGVARRGGAAGCRWVAVRHADDHVHIVATLVGQDGRSCWPRNDFRRIGEVCRAAESRLGLTGTPPRDGTAAPRPTRAETARAARTGRPETDRGRLRREVRAVAVAATDPGDFVARLRRAGMLVHERWSVVDPSIRTGYAVAVPDVTGTPVFFAGGKLASDLTLPRLAVTWTTTSGGASSARPVGVRATPAERREMWRQARDVVDEVAGRVQSGVLLGAPAVDPAGTRDLLAGLAWSLEGGSGGSLTAAAELLDRAAREPYRRTVPPGADGLRLRHAARLIAASGRLSPTAGSAALVSSLVVLADGIAALRTAQRRAAQASAARQAADAIRPLGRPTAGLGPGTGLAPAAPRVPAPAATRTTRSTRSR